MLMDIWDAHNRHTRALTLRGALIHSDTHTENRRTRRRKQASLPQIEPMLSRNRQHVVIFSIRAEKGLIVMEGAPKCCLTGALRQPEERKPALQRSNLAELMPELTWSGVHSLTPEILCSLISSRCHLLPLLPTFNDTVSADYRDTAVSFPLMAQRTDDQTLSFSRTSCCKMRSDEFKSLLKKIKNKNNLLSV